LTDFINKGRSRVLSYNKSNSSHHSKDVFSQGSTNNAEVFKVLQTDAHNRQMSKLKIENSNLFSPMFYPKAATTGNQRQTTKFNKTSNKILQQKVVSIIYLKLIAYSKQLKVRLHNQNPSPILRNSLTKIEFKKFLTEFTGLSRLKCVKETKQFEKMIQMLTPAG
jgi:hypothetical protein